MFDRFISDNSSDKSFISPEEIALIPHKKEASNFIALTQKQKLNVLESLLLERVANNEDAEDIMQAIAKQQLNVLMEAQWGDDWTCEYFIERLPEVAEQSNICGAEFDNLMAWISSLSREQVYALQVALMGFLDLPTYKDTFEM